MTRLFDTLYTAFAVPEGTQIVYEGNPDSLSERKIQILAENGRVTRLTIGVQTLDDKVQAIVRRHNKPEHVIDALVAARKYEIAHVNCDIMAGLPEQTMASFQQDLAFLVSLEPDTVHLNAYRPLPRVRLERDGHAMDSDTVKLRDEMMAWGDEYLGTHGHGSHAQGHRRRTQSAANVQEYDLRRQNSSLLGLGFPARSHSFGNHYYMPDAAQGFDAALDGELSGGGRQWRAVKADDNEEVHKYLVSNLRTGFDLAEYTSLFGGDPRDVAGEALERLYELGVLHVSDGQVLTDTGDHGSNLIYRTLLMSPAHLARARVVWGDEYSPEEDYRARVQVLCESCG